MGGAYGEDMGEEGREGQIIKHVCVININTNLHSVA